MKIPPGHIIRFPREGGPPGDYGSIAFSNRQWKMFNKVEAEARSKLEAVMRAWCRFGPTDMPTTKFRFEGRARKNGKSIRIDAFKAWQVRFYGMTIEVNGKQVFLVSEVDLAKKQDDAKKTKVDNAYEVASGLLKEALK